ncbi:MAG TPA: hypothetical protein VNH15_05170 [Elusimicrobiota bacterium]|nr:hypothetical protein [Elusimicrobiota bacterium]
MLVRGARCLRLLLLAALLGQAQVPIALLQTFAWGRMAWRYSRTHSAQRAMAMTFDGKHPCSLCLKIRKSVQPTKTVAARPFSSYAPFFPPRTFHSAAALAQTNLAPSGGFSESPSFAGTLSPPPKAA